MVVTRFVFIHPIQDHQYVLVNSMSGAVDVVGADIIEAFEAIRSGAPHNLPAETVEDLTYRGYLFESRAAEDLVVDRVIELNQNMRKETSALAFVVCPTMSCNLRCPYCFEPHKLHESTQVMSDEQVERAFFAMDEIRKMRPDMPQASINLFGGEPLLPITKNVVGKIMQKAAERDLNVTITTNGTHTAAFLDILSTYRQDALFLQITMDGIKEIHDERRITAGGTGTFDIIANNIDKVLEAGLQLEVRMNLNDDNVDAVPAYLEFVKERGWHKFPNFRIGLSPVTNYTGLFDDGVLPPHVVEDRVRQNVDPKWFETVNVQLNGDFSRLTLSVGEALGESLMAGSFMPSLYYCEASGGLFYNFTPDGLIYPCNQILGDTKWAIGTYDPEFYIDPDKAVLWEGRAVTNMPKCMDCSIAFMCGGGCPVKATNTIGTPMDSYCGTSKKDLRNYLDSVAHKLIQIEENPV